MKVITNGPSGEVVPVAPDDDPQPSPSSLSSSKPIPDKKKQPTKGRPTKGRPNESSSSKPNEEEMGTRTMDPNIANMQLSDERVRNIARAMSHTWLRVGIGQGRNKWKNYTRCNTNQ